jgi:hypothetical protein
MIRFLNMSGFAAANERVSAIGRTVRGLLEKALIQADGNKDA